MARADKDFYGMDSAFPEFVTTKPDSLLYYECHITIEPMEPHVVELLKPMVANYHFRIADLYMTKRKEDTPERSKYDTFMTGRDKNYNALKHNMTQLIKSLQKLGITVWRYKIEDTIIDSKIKDIERILDGN